MKHDHEQRQNRKITLQQQTRTRLSGKTECHRPARVTRIPERRLQVRQVQYAFTPRLPQCPCRLHLVRRLTQSQCPLITVGEA